MNRKQVVDIYFNFVENEMTFYRRKDDKYYVQKDVTHLYLLGQATCEGSELKISNKLPWKRTDEDFCIDWVTTDAVTAIRDSGTLIIASPLYPWGKAPDITIEDRISFMELGAKILEQFEFIKTKRLENPREEDVEVGETEE